MARAEPIDEIEISGDEVETTTKPKSKLKAKGKAAEEEVEVEGAEEGSNGEEEEEFEIEAVIDAKRGYFGDKKYAYLVAWKNYGSEHNSWVSEADAENAHELIQIFWEKRKGQKSISRKGTESKAKTTASARAAGRKSIDKDEGTSAISKRGRGRATKKTSVSDGSGSEAESEPKTKKKKADTTAASASASAKTSNVKSFASMNEPDANGDTEMGNTNGEVVEANGLPPFTTMTKLKYNKRENWERYVKTITTVEKVKKEGKEILYVYFQTTKGEFVREESSLCNKQFPQKLLEFYEGNLKWKMAVEEDGQAKMDTDVDAEGEAE